MKDKFYDLAFTPQKLVDDNFNTVWQGDYFAFGNVNETVNQIENNLRFPGQYYDSETGFYYNFHRYYAPEIGRYLREDPVRNGLNYYLYVNGNPVEGLDDKGLKPEWCKCEKTREKRRRECEEKCKQDHKGILGRHTVICSVGYGALSGLIGKILGSLEIVESPELAGAAIVGAGVTFIGGLICAPGDIWCPFKCWLDEITYCTEPEDWNFKGYGFRH